ncbi:porin family protein [Francisellaceae bacterium]|nr:porin family protein [Francisellaceae bacterium]
MNLKNCKLISSSVFVGCFIYGSAMADNPLYVGANLGGDFSPRDARSTSNNVAGLLNIGYQNNKYFSAQVSGMLARYNMGYIIAEGLYTIPVNQFITPYVELGLGYTHLTGSGVGFNAGGGFKVNLSNQLSLSIDYRYVFQFTSNTPSTNVLSGGITWYFGRNDDVFTFNPHPKPVKFIEKN